ncbi:phospholipase D A [Rhagoletis pomonella]|uniref:phospholipase D A n=1 Tax=Rhagoletis pomonella TaxID=28610 RepID=UPI00177C9DE1|nr:phospholipase D A [Rhagoletis pomonella]
MSNGDEVLDNWEEIDEVGLTNTLQKIQQKQRDTQQKTYSAKLCSNLPTTSENTPASLLAVYPQTTKLTSTVDPDQFTLSKADFPTSAVAATVPMKLLQRNACTSNTTGGNVSVTTAGTSADADLKSPLEDMAASFQPVMMLLHKPADEYQSTTYAAPTNLQTVKILRRPTQSMEPRNNGIKPRQPIKTLQQREQEYAEARLRILGSAKNPEDEAGAANTSNSTAATTTAIVNATASTNNSYKGNATSPKGNQSGGNNGGGGGGNGSPLNLYNNYYNQQQQQQQQANYYYMQQQKQHQQQQQIPPAYNTRSMSALLPLPLPTTLQHQHQQQQPKLQPQTQHQTWSPVVGGSVSSTALRQQQQESILRLPRGPDGSTGFQMRR